MKVGLERITPVGEVAVGGIVAIPDEGLGNRAYLVDLGDGRAMVIDPARPIPIPGGGRTAGPRDRLQRGDPPPRGLRVGQP
jgi:hypothetical protein